MDDINATAPAETPSIIVKSDEGTEIKMEEENATATVETSPTLGKADEADSESMTPAPTVEGVIDAPVVISVDAKEIGADDLLETNELVTIQNGEEENDTVTPKKPKTQGSPLPVVSSGREQRTRKSVDSYEPTITKKEIIIPVGKGEKLKDIPNVVQNLSEVTWSDPHLKMLHTLIFGRGQKREFKAHLLEFNGLDYGEGKEEEEREKMKLKMYKLQMPDLKTVMDLCGIDRSHDSLGKGQPDKEMLCNRLLEWLEHPKASGKRVTGVQSKSVKPSKKTVKTSKKDFDSVPKKRGRPKGPAPKEKASSKKVKSSNSDVDIPDLKKDIDFNIPGATIKQVREKVKNIVENANREELTVKSVREILEEWLDTDLSNYKDAIRTFVMDAM